MDKHQEIFDKMHRLRDQERKDREVLLKEHSEKYSALRSDLIRECKEIGHIKGPAHNNGLGYSWHYCSVCGGRIEETIEFFG